MITAGHPSRRPTLSPSDRSCGGRPALMHNTELHKLICPRCNIDGAAQLVRQLEVHPNHFPDNHPAPCTCAPCASCDPSCIWTSPCALGLSHVRAGRCRSLPYLCEHLIEHLFHTSEIGGNARLAVEWVAVFLSPDIYREPVCHLSNDYLSNVFHNDFRFERLL
jgi:hypothetical protein